MIAANTGLIEDYLAGRAALPPQDAGPPAAAAPGRAGVVHNSQQLQFKRLLDALVGVSNTPTPLRRKFPHVSQSVGDLESEAGSAASVLERGRLRGFGLGARPAPRLRSWSEAGSAASVLEPAPGPHQGFFRM